MHAGELPFPAPALALPQRRCRRRRGASWGQRRTLRKWWAGGGARSPFGRAPGAALFPRPLLSLGDIAGCRRYRAGAAGSWCEQLAGQGSAWLSVLSLSPHPHLTSAPAFYDRTRWPARCRWGWTSSTSCSPLGGWPRWAGGACRFGRSLLPLQAAPPVASFSTLLLAPGCRDAHSACWEWRCRTCEGRCRQANAICK